MEKSIVCSQTWWDTSFFLARRLAPHFADDSRCSQEISAWWHSTYFGRSTLLLSATEKQTISGRRHSFMFYLPSLRCQNQLFTYGRSSQQGGKSRTTLTSVGHSFQPTFLSSILRSFYQKPHSPKKQFPIGERWTGLQKFFKLFSSMWSKCHLKTLRERQKCRQPGRNFQVNDLLLIQDDWQPPVHWPIGKIAQGYHGSDNQVEAMVVEPRIKELHLHESCSQVSPFSASEQTNQRWH